MLTMLAIIAAVFFTCAFLICIRLEAIQEARDWEKRKVWERLLLICIAGLMLSILTYIGVR